MPCVRLRIQSKITRHADNQEKGTRDPEKDPSSGTDPGMTETMRLAGNGLTKRPHKHAEDFERKHESHEERDGKYEEESSAAQRK